MRFAVAREHRDFFNKQGTVEFEGLLNAKQLVELVAAVDSTLALRLNIQASELSLQSSNALFMAGRDLWRANNAVKKIVMQRQFAELAIELIHKKTLRLGYDQFFPDGAVAVLPGDSQNLLEISCLQGVQCGLMLCLRGALTPVEPVEPVEEDCTPSPLFSRQAGSGVFFNPEAPLNFQRSVGQYLMIVYTSTSSVYLCKRTDPHANALKQYGYAFGDKLNDKCNPIVYR